MPPSIHPVKFCTTDPRGLHKAFSSSTVTNLLQVSEMHKRHSSTIPPTLLVRDSNTSTLHDLRLLITTDKFQKVEESRDIERVLTQLKALKQASRELHSTRDRCEALQEAFKKEGDPSFFYSLYKLHFQNLQHKIIDRRLNDPSLSTSPLACLSQKNIVTVTRFLSFLRSNPQTITKALCNHHSEDLYNLIKINPSVLKPTSIPDILLYSLFDSPNFTEEQKLRQDLWKDIFVSLIKDKKGDNFMLEALERYMRLYQWSPKGALEITLMKLLRQGEDALKLLEEENSGRKKSSLSRTHSFSSSMIYLHPSGSLGASAPYHHANAVEMDRFLDSACLEILGILHHYVPISLVNLTQAILHDLPQKLHHYATIQVMVKFFFYKFLGKVICYPEFFGLCEDHFISEKRRQRILFTVHQRLYRYVTAVTSSVPGWSRRSLNIDARIRAQVEKIVALFTLPNSSDQALTNVHDLGQPPILPSHFSQVPSPLAFPSITPTLLMSSEDIIELYDFLSTSTADPQEQPDTSSRFSDILFELLPVISILKGQESFSALFHVKPGGERILDDMTPSFLSLDFMSPTNDLEENVTCREETQVVGEALFKVLENYGDASIALPPGKFSSLPPGSEGLHEAIRLAIQSARFYNYLGDAVSFQKALGYLEKLPDDMTRDNHSGLIRLLARGIERTKAVRDLRYRERQAWLAYLQEFESQLRHAATRLESRCSNLRLHIFYSTFRATKTYEKHRSSLLELSGRIQLDEGEAAQVENYLQTSKVCDFIPGDERFHLFCLRIQALCCSAIANLWTCDGYSRESSLFHSRSSSATIPSLPSPPSSSASSFHSMHLTAPAIDSRDPLAVRSLAFANHAASDFPSAIQLRISTLLLSEFFAAFRSSEVDGWFAEFVSDFDPPDAEPESKASSAPFSTPSLSGLAEVSDKPLARFCDSPTHSLSSCSQSPISDSSASASSVAISLPINSMPPSPLVVASRSDYLSLCNQVTLHHSPLRKLRLLFSLELLIVANLSATDTPGTDSIINEIERVFRRIRPRHLFRDLQLIAAFVPNSILDLTDEGKAFWDFSLASLSLKKEAVDRAVSRATSLIDAMTRRPASSDDPLSSDQLDLLERRQQSEALRLFTLAAKEGHAEAQRELGILYLSLPSLTVDLPQSSPSFLGALYSGSNTSNYPPRGPDGDKYDPANVESALYWFGRAAAQGDAFSVQYLTHRGGAFSLPPSLRSHNSGANTISRPTIRAQSAVYRSSSTPPSPKVSRSPTGSSVSKLPRCLDSVQKFSA